MFTKKFDDLCVCVVTEHQIKFMLLCVEIFNKDKGRCNYCFLESLLFATLGSLWSCSRLKVMDLGF